jgi:hypothetical protein
MVINTTNNYAGSCAFTFNNSRNALAIMQDSGTAWSATMTVGVPGTLQNSQCSVDLGASRADRSDNDLILHLAITAKPSFFGVRSIFMKAVDAEGMFSPWGNFGTWNTTPVAPTTVFVNPSSNTNTLARFEFRYADFNGATDIANVYLLFNTTNSYVGSCGVTFNNSRNALAVIQDSGTAWSPVKTVGVAGTLENSQCSINLAASSANRIATDLILALTITFKPSFSGAKSIFMKAVDRENMMSSWDNRGTSNPVFTSAPTPVSVTPNTGTGNVQTFAFLYSDNDGVSDIANVYLLFNPTNSYVGSCGVTFNNSRSALALIQDSGTAWSAVMTVGVPGTLQNSQCSINLGASSATRVGNNLTLNLAITFKPAFTGPKNIFMKAVDRGGRASNWLNTGNWTVP